MSELNGRQHKDQHCFGFDVNVTGRTKRHVDHFEKCRFSCR
ncbi:hypothetical protein LEP1GSC188_3583 [Leptospira weilii serovar Topaz str. LT2116]|uniref:Uncharacterized protein n=1 Tax=Leptospira weilii serovar Topaz str. LT2116 TaxID=1088540 RepID=M3G565_9LEPT|nr:hypothetical protein LEP1GSC188_3583 [Leptospira weilii serovar Topaz str. LT2116]